VKGVIDHLANVIGERFGGSEGDRRAAGYMAERFATLGLDVSVQEFGFIGWRPTRAPSLRVLDDSERVFDCEPVLYSAPTPAGGLRGRLVRHGRVALIPGVYDLPAFSLLDVQDGELARIIVELGGPAIPLINPRPMFRLPQVVVGSESEAELVALADRGDALLELEIGAELDADARSQNVIGRYTGAPQTSEVVVVCAHIDTTIGTPGAYDNASGIAGMYGVAQKLLAAAPPINVEFIAMACEEQGFHGASYYVTDRKERGVLGEVRAVVNLDQISGGEFLWVWSGPHSFARDVAATLAALPALDRFEVRHSAPMAGADDWLFAVEGIPTVSLIFWRLPVYHKAADTPDAVDMETVRACRDAALALVERAARGELYDAAD
jgi:aminopeptidase YwaD